MIESIKCTNELPDSNYKFYIATREQCHNFKNYIPSVYSFYKSMDFCMFPIDKKTGNIREPISTQKHDFISSNWRLLNDQNIKKANFICYENYDIPTSKHSISQTNIFNNQKEKFVNPKDSVAILNAFPLFLYEYFK